MKPKCKSAELLAYLAKHGDLSATNVRILGSFIQTWKTSAFEAIRETHVLSETELADVLAQRLQLPRLAQIQASEITHEALSKISYERARQWRCLPIRFLSTKPPRLLVAVVDPTNESDLAAIEAAALCEVEVAVADCTQLMHAIDDMYPARSQFQDLEILEDVARS